MHEPELPVTVFSSRELQALALAGRKVTVHGEQWTVVEVVAPTFRAHPDGHGHVAVVENERQAYGNEHLILEGSDGYQMIALIEEVRPGVCLSKLSGQARDAADPSLEHTVDATLPGHFHGLAANDLLTLQSAFSLLVAASEERWTPPMVMQAHKALR